jgi:hypothetical protein
MLKHPIGINTCFAVMAGKTDDLKIGKNRLATLSPSHEMVYVEIIPE